MLNREIYTYMDLRTLGNAPFWKEIRNFPQITVTADLRKSLKGVEQYDKVDGLFMNDSIVQVSEFRKLADLAVPHWTDDETKFHESIVLAQFIRQQIHRFGDDLDIRHWLVGCRRNLSMLLSSIVILEEAGISPEDVHSGKDRNIELLLSAWKFLMNNDPAIDNFHKRMKQLENRDSWNPILNKLFGRSNIQTIVFHGFYYFTPLQERIIRLMEKSGITIKMLFCYDERYPYANEIWRKTYSRENGYEDFTKWKKEKGIKPEAYGEIFEGRKANISNRVSVREYASVMEFVHEIKCVKEEGYFVYSSNPNKANEILKDFYPEEYGERKLLSYPIGQFVSTLNKMWDEDEQQIILDAEMLIEFFSCGWLAVEGNSGINYLQDLIRILPFFSDCKYMKDWKERCCFWEQVEEAVILSFESNNELDSRWKKVMGNPLLNFSVFSIAYERAEIVLQLIRQLLHIAEELFSVDKAISIQEYIGKLDRILMEYEISNELYEEEREIVREIFEKFRDASEFSAKCYPGDISIALNLYMNGNLKDEEIQMDKGALVKPLYQVDSATVYANEKVHICLCDMTNMPGGKKEYVWPLTRTVIQKCYEKTHNPLIRNMFDVMECSYICNRYMLYSALKNKDVQLSWISKIGDKIQAPSPYIRLLYETTGVTLNPAITKQITYQNIFNICAGTRRTVQYDETKMPEQISKEARMDYAVCPVKYVLGYVLEEFPTFENEFQQNYAINSLIAVIYSLMKEEGISSDIVYDHVIELFPAMRKAEKRQVYDYLHYENSFHDVEFKGISELDSVLYTEERLKVRFPKKEIRDFALEEYVKLMTPDGKKKLDFYNTNLNNKLKGEICAFCQHQNYCGNALFKVDQEGFYD